VRRAPLLADPVTAHWWRHPREHPVREGERVLFLRRWLGADGGEGRCPTQAASWPDVKRTYATAHHCAVLDFGPASVDGWLADLAADELGVQDVLALDGDAGEVVVDGRRIALTPLEFGVLSHLYAGRGKVVSRSAVLRDVWGYDEIVGGNVVDSVIRAPRKELGTQASSIETVRGFGYRCRL